MTAPYQSLEQQVHALQEENRSLRAELERIEQRAAAAQEARVRLLRGTWRIMVPLLDRNRVVRSFAQLAQTTSDFANPMSKWPPKEQVLADARDFMESCVRFMIRRRTLILLFSLLATAVPALQIWLAHRQNEMIENQNDFFRVQVYDIVSRTMTEGDRNARQMTGALLANTKLEFLKGVVEEAFGSGFQWGAYRRGDIDALERRLEDAAFRSHLIRALVRGIQQRAAAEGDELDDLDTQVTRMIRQVLNDSADRVPQVLRLGRQEGDIDPALLEQVDYYLIQIGELLRVYGRLARTVGKEKQFFSDIRPLFVRMAGRREAGESRFAEVYQPIMQDFLFELALQPKLQAAPVNLGASGTTPDEALKVGLDRLRKGLGDKALDWALFASQVGMQ
jgi:hypothetical protein